MKLLLKSAWDSAANKVTRMLSRSLGPVAPDFELPIDKKVVNKPPSSGSITEIPEPPYSHLSEQERFAIFESWMTKYDKEYRTEGEKLHRYEVFKDGMMFIERMCAQVPKPCYLGLNSTADLNEEEYLEQLGMRLGGSLDID